jgi:ubiquinone/menaquinone biosynthesis C-methylase UbiE
MPLLAPELILGWSISRVRRLEDRRAGGRRARRLEAFRDNRCVADAIVFDQDLFRGTAHYYDRFRPRYPQEMMAELIDWAQPSGRGRLLDLACGTGQVAFAIAEHFGEVWAVDQEPDMIRVVREKAEVRGAGDLRAVVSSAESLDAPPDGFELVTIGNAFHRLRRDVVAANALRWLKPGGCIALLWSTGPASGKREWQRALSDVLARWTTRVGAQSRVPAGWEQVRRERPDTEVVTAAGFHPVHSARFFVEYDWTVKTLLGYVYSTSALPKAALDASAAAFESDLQRELDAYTSGGVLRATIDSAYELARRPR